MSESPEITAPSENEVRLCACGSPRRPGAFDCKKCHREQMRRSRKHRRDQWEHLQRAVESLTIDNPETLGSFDSPFFMVSLSRAIDLYGYAQTVLHLLFAGPAHARVR